MFVYITFCGASLHSIVEEHTTGDEEQDCEDPDMSAYTPEQWAAWFLSHCTCGTTPETDSSLQSPAPAHGSPAHGIVEPTATDPQKSPAPAHGSPAHGIVEPTATDPQKSPASANGSPSHGTTDPLLEQTATDPDLPAHGLPTEPPALPAESAPPSEPPATFPITKYTWKASEFKAYRSKEGRHESSSGWLKVPGRMGMAVATWDDGDWFEVPGVLFHKLGLAPKNARPQRNNKGADSILPAQPDVPAEGPPLSESKPDAQPGKARGRGKKRISNKLAADSSKFENDGKEISAAGPSQDDADEADTGADGGCAEAEIKPQKGKGAGKSRGKKRQGQVGDSGLVGEEDVTEDGEESKPWRPLQYWLLKRPEGVTCTQRHQQWNAMSKKEKTAFGQDSWPKRQRHSLD